MRRASKLLALLLLFPGLTLHAASKLDVGAEYRLRGIQLTNPTYASELPLGSGNSFDQKYYSQRARVYLAGKLDPGIEIGAVIQAIGVSGSTAALLGRYPKEDFSPFMENAYVAANEIFGWPMNVTLGRQPYVWGSGLLIADDGMGFDGIRLDAGPFWGIRGHIFTAKAREKFVGENDSDLNLAGLEYNWGIHNIRLGYIMESNKSGGAYQSLTATNPVTADQINRQYVDLQVDGKLEQGAFYKAEYAMQRGTAKGITFIDKNSRQLITQDVTLSGSALTFEGGFDFLHPRYRRMILAFVFMQGSGDDATTDGQDEKFNPSFGHKYDGLERSGYGEFFAATPYSFFNEDKLIVQNQVAGTLVQSFPYNTLFSGLRMYGFRGSINPWEPFTAGLEFYLYSARETPFADKRTPTTILESALGRELIISANYNYAKRILFSVRWGKFFPNATLNNLGSSRLILEASAKF